MDTTQKTTQNNPVDELFELAYKKVLDPNFSSPKSEVEKHSYNIPRHIRSKNLIYQEPRICSSKINK